MRSFLILLLWFGLIWTPGPAAATDNLLPPFEQANHGAAAQSPQQGISSNYTKNNVDIHDIHGPVATADRSWLAIVLLAGAIAIILFVVVYFLLKKRRNKPIPPPAVDQAALAELHTIRILMETNRSLLYLERASDILRNYIEARFHIPCSRKTSREILQTVHTGEAGREVIDRSDLPALQSCFALCDKGKYSRHLPGREEMLMVEQTIEVFITKTGGSPQAAGES